MSWTEVKLGFRLMRKQPVMSIASILALATAIGLATAGYTFTDAVLFSELPFEKGDRFVILTVLEEPDGLRAGLDLERFHRFREGADTLDHIGAMRGTQFNVIHPSGEVEPVPGAFLTPSSFRHLPFAPLAGRSFIARDGERGAPAVALIRESFWERQFGRAEEAIGTILNVGGVEREVVGVMPNDFEFPNAGEIWAPLDEEFLGAEEGSEPIFRLIGVLREGASVEAAQAQLRVISGNVALETPSQPEIRLKLDLFTQIIRTPAHDALLAGLVTVLVLVLLVIASNVANLFLARNSSRFSELSVRTALGANRGRLVGQLFLEVLLLGGIAAILGAAASQAIFQWVDGAIDEIPFWIDFTPNPRTIAFVTFLTLLASAVGGLFPALKATRRDTADALRAGNQEGAGIGLGRIGSAMIVVEMALSVALLSGALVFARGLVDFAGADFSLPKNQVLTATLLDRTAATNRQISSGERGAQDSLAAKQRAVIKAVARIPGVLAAGASEALPRQDSPIQLTALEAVDGEDRFAPGPAPVAAVRPGFFEALDVRPSLGRLLTEADFLPGAPPVAVVNEPFVERFLSGRSPIGRRIRAVLPDREGEQPVWREIVGVAPDLGMSASDPDSAGGYYVPMKLGERRYFNILLRTQGDPARLAGPLRESVASVDPSIFVRRVMPLEKVGGDEQQFFSVMASSQVAMGSMALLLSLMGIYAIVSFTVTRRTREIGIRLALGAAHRQILARLLARACALLGAGALLGLVLGIAFVQGRAIFVTRLPDAGPEVFMIVIGLMAGAGVLACWIPARRALRIRPSEALRYD